VRGKLQGEIRTQFEQHLQECERHTQAVQLEKSLRNGVIEFARNQIRSNIRKDLRRPQEEVRYAILRYAAFLFVAVVVPLMLYYQFRIFQPDIKSSRIVTTQKVTVDSSQEHSARNKEKSARPVTESTAARTVTDRAKKSESVPPVVETSAEAEQGIQLNAALPDMESDSRADEKLASQPAPPTAEQPSLTMEKQAGTEIGQIATGAQGVPPESIVESQRSMIKADESKTEDLEKKSAGGYAKKEQYAPIPSNLKEGDSSRNEIVFMVDGISVLGQKPSIDDQNIDNQITAQQANLLTCTAGLDSTDFLTVKFIITRQGLVENLQVIYTNIQTKNVEQCIIEKIRHWKFKAPVQKTVVTRRINLKQ
jgi:hypothetical protein